MWFITPRCKRFSHLGHLGLYCTFLKRKRKFHTKRWYLSRIYYNLLSSVVDCHLLVHLCFSVGNWVCDMVVYMLFLNSIGTTQFYKWFVFLWDGFMHYCLVITI